MDNDDWVPKSPVSKVEKHACRCGHVSEPGKEVWEYRNASNEGIFIHCPECRGFPVVQVLIKDEVTKKAIKCEPEEPSIRRQVLESFKDDQQKGEKGGSSNKSYLRKKPLTRLQVRWEQDIPAFVNSRSGDIKIERLEVASERVKLSLPVDIKSELDIASEVIKAEGGAEWSHSRILKKAFRENVHDLDIVKSISRGIDKVDIQLRLFPSESLILERAIQEYDATPTEVFAECLKIFLERK